MRPPPGDRAEHSPVRPAGVPRGIGGEPPVARAEEPIPAGGRIPALVGRRAGDLVFDFRLGHGAAEIVVRLDGGRNFLTQRHRLGRGRDAHLELGLLVLLDPERATSALRYEDVILTERRVRGELERSVEPSELVGGELLGENFLTLGVPDLDVERLAGEICCVGLIVARARDPELESHRRSGAIDRPIGDRVDLDLVISGIVVAVSPDVGEAQVGQPAFGRGRGDEPLVSFLAGRPSRPS